MIFRRNPSASGRVMSDLLTQPLGISPPANEYGYPSGRKAEAEEQREVSRTWAC